MCQKWISEKRRQVARMPQHARSLLSSPERRIGTMSAAPLQFLLLLFSGWVNRRQQAVIDYLVQENRVLREQLRGRRLRFTDDQRRRLARKGRLLARRVLENLDTVVTLNTILRWYRELVAKKYDSSRRRRPGGHRLRPGCDS